MIISYVTGSAHVCLLFNIIIFVSSQKLTKCMVQEIASSISEELPPGFPKEVLEGISTAAHVKTFADCVAFVKTLLAATQRRVRFASTAYVRVLQGAVERGPTRIIVFIRYESILILLPCQCVTFYYVILEKRSYRPLA